MKTYNLQGQLPPNENVWPPASYLPKTYIPLLLLQHKEVKHYSTTIAQYGHLGYTGETVCAGPLLKRARLHEPDSDEILSTSKITNSIEEMLAPFSLSEPQFILIEGAPGIGKTYLIQEIARFWGNGEILRAFKLVLIVRLREYTSCPFKNFEELLQSFFKGENVTEGITLCSKYFSSNGGKEFLFDGFDELPEDRLHNSFISNILMRKSFPCCGIVISSRPSYADSIRNKYKLTNLVNILGFNEEERNSYINKALHGSTKEIENITQHLETHFTISNLCFVPFNMAVLLYLFVKKHYLPENIFELYNYCVCCTIHRYLTRKGQSNEDKITCSNLKNLPEPYKTVINQLSKFAMETLLIDKIIFTEEEVKSACPDVTKVVDGFGLLQAVEKSNEIGKTYTYHFIHFSIQEFLAAYYIACLSPDQTLKALEKQFWESKHFNMFAIYVAYTQGKEESFKKYLSDGNSAVAISERFLLDPHKCIRLFRCFYEIKDEEMCKCIAQAKIFENDSIKLQNILPFSDIECLTTFLANSFQKEWKSVELKGCCIRDQGVRILHHGLKKCNTSISNLNLSDNNIGLLSAEFISNITRHCQVKRLYLIGNKTIGENEKIFTRLLQSPSFLETLHLSRTKLTSEAAMRLFTTLEQETKLKELWVSYNQIKDDAFPMIAKSLEKNKTLIKLRIRSNPFSAKSAQYLIEALNHCTTIQELWLPTYDEEDKRKLTPIKDEIIKKTRSQEYQKTFDLKFYK